MKAALCLRNSSWRYTRNPATATLAKIAIVSPAPVFGSDGGGGVTPHCGESTGKLESLGHWLQAALPVGTPGLHSGVGGVVGVTTAGQAAAVTL
jgi:hypothetical protein